jgi:hypothetical protein
MRSLSVPRTRDVKPAKATVHQQKSGGTKNAKALHDKDAKTAIRN